MGRDAVNAVPKGLLVGGIIAACVVALAAGAWVLLRILNPISSTVTGIAFAILLTSLLIPAHRLVRKVIRNNHAAAGLTVVGFIVFVLGLTGLAGAQIVTGFGELRDSVFDALAALETWLREGPFGVSGGIESIGLADYIERLQEWMTAHSGQLLTGALAAGSAVTTFSVAVVLALITTFFFLADGRRIWLWCVGLLPDHVEDRVDAAFAEGFESVRAYVKTQAIVAAVDAVGIGAGALLLGLPLVIPMTIIVFITAFIPVIGAFLSGAIVVLIAGFTKGLGGAVIMLIIVLVVQQIESNVLQPMLMSKAVSLHPWGVIIGVAVGGAIYGIVGALFAVPVMAMVNVVVKSLHNRGVEDEPDDPDQPDGELGDLAAS